MNRPFSPHARSREDPLWKRGGGKIEDAAELFCLFQEAGLQDGGRADLGEDPARKRAELASHLVDGDRLDLLERGVRWMTKRCYLLDVTQLAYQSIEAVLAAADDLRPEHELDEWLEQRIEVAGGILIEEDADLARRNVVAEEPLEPRLQFLIEALRFSPANVRRAVAAANDLSNAERHVFFHCFVLGNGFGRYGEQAGVDGEHVRTLFLQAIDKLSDAVGDTE